MDPLTRDGVRADIAAQLYLEPEELLDTANLFDEGLDSVRLIELVSRWRTRGAQVNFAQLAEEPNLRAWWAAMAGPGTADV